MSTVLFTRGEDIKYPLYIIDGKQFDFSEWIPKHPGGARWFSRCNGRDISVAFYAYHKNPEKLQKLLKKYEVKGQTKNETVDPSLNVPPFLVPAGFDARQDVPEFDFTKKGVLTYVQAKLRTPEWERKIRFADFAFDVVTLLLFCSHVLLAWPIMTGQMCTWMPTWANVVLLGITRTSLAAVGHYHCHRAKDGFTDWADCFFDLQYVGAHMITYDGHVMLHHLYTGTDADVKRTFFTGMIELPRLWRVPFFTLHKFGVFFSGMLIRSLTFQTENGPEGTYWPVIKAIQFYIIRFYMLFELYVAYEAGKFHVFVMQFALTLWMNLFMIVASHDFENVRDEDSEKKSLEKIEEKEWAVHQVLESLDTYVTGIPYIDVFLSAGLGCHRAHHVLPYQKSGFANIVSTPLLKEACEENNVPWEPTAFLPGRIVSVAIYNLFAPMSRGHSVSRDDSKKVEKNMVKDFILEHLHPKNILFTLQLSVVGFLGEGAV